MKPKVSIIVPIYNMEEHLERCLESLTNQTLKDIEIIAVNDGSIDQSQDIISKYSEKDSRIKAVNQSNSGVSAARNKGISLASGEFIGFVDPDDWIESDMYGKLYEIAKKETADIVMCSYIREFQTHSKVKKFDLPDRVIFEQEDIKHNLLRRLVGPIDEEVGNPEMLDAWGTVWSKLYRSDLIKNNKLSFVDLKEIGTNEDSLFNLYVLYFARKFIFLNQPCYHYWRENKQSVTSTYKPDFVNQFFTLYGKLEEFIVQKNLDQSFYQALNNRICLNTLGLGFNAISDTTTAHREKWQRISLLLNDKRLKQSFKQFELDKFPLVWRFFYFCAKKRFTFGFYCLIQTAEFLRKRMK